LLRKQQKTLGGYFFLPHPVYGPVNGRNVFAQHKSKAEVDLVQL